MAASLWAAAALAQTPPGHTPAAPSVDALVERGQYDDAERELDRLAAVITPGDRRERSTLLTIRARIASDRGRFQQAQQALGEALRLLADTAHSDLLVEILITSGSLHQRQGNYVRAEALFAEAATWQRALSIRKPRPRVQLARATLALSAGEEMRAAALIRDARQGCEREAAQTQPHACQARVDLAAGELALDTGDLERARRLLSAAEHFLGKQGRLREQVRAMKALASAHWKLGERSRATTWAERALTLSGGIGYRSIEAGLHHMLAEIALEAGRQEAARRHLLAARERYQEMRSRPGLAGSRMVLAGLATRSGAWDEASAHLAAALSTYRGMGDGRGAAHATLALADIARRRGDVARERKLLREVTSGAVVPPDVWKARARLGELQLDGGSRDASIRTLNHALAESERVESSRLSLAARERLHSERLRVYDLLVEAWLDDARPDARATAGALEASERSVARSFLDLLERARIRSTKPGAVSLLSELERLDTRERSLLARAARQPGRSPGLDVDLRRVQRRRLRLESELQSRYPGIASPILGNIAGRVRSGLAHVRADLSDDVAILKYHLASPRSYVFVLHREALHVVPLPGREELAPKLEAYYRAVQRPLTSRRARRRRMRLARELYATLLRPAEAHLDGRTRLVIVPHNELRVLPFDTLIRPDGPAPTSQPRRPSYAVLHYTISYAPSIAAVSELHREARLRSRRERFPLVAFGDPEYAGVPLARRHLPRLRWSGKEARSASTHLDANGGPGGLYLRENATEERLKTLALNRYRIVHLATHALTNGGSGQPDQPALVLGRSPNDDGILRMDEVLGLNLDADLVVLSACGSGASQRDLGDGLGGLTRAFLYAGSSSVMATLWAVEDTHAARLMETFYRRLASGDRSAEALRAARVALLQGRAPTKSPAAAAPRGIGGIFDPKAAKPKRPPRRRPKKRASPTDAFFWASFVLVGDSGDILR